MPTTLIITVVFTLVLTLLGFAMGAIMYNDNMFSKTFGQIDAPHQTRKIIAFCVFGGLILIFGLLMMLSLIKVYGDSE